MSRPEASVARSQAYVAGAVAVTLIATALSGFVPAIGSSWGLARLAPLSGLVGLVSPVIAYRMYLLILERAPKGDLDARCAAFEKANWTAMLVTGAVALVGVAAYAATRQTISLLGVATQVLIAGAVWPTPDKIERLLET